MSSTKRLLLAACGLLVVAAQLALIVLSAFLHAPGDDVVRLGTAVHGHAHDFELAAAPASQSEPVPCVACLLARNPALLPAEAATSAAAAFTPFVPARSHPFHRSALVAASDPRGPPSA